MLNRKCLLKVVQNQIHANEAKAMIKRNSMDLDTFSKQTFIELFERSLFRFIHKIVFPLLSSKKITQVTRIVFQMNARSSTRLSHNNPPDKLWYSAVTQQSTKLDLLQGCHTPIQQTRFGTGLSHNPPD